MGRKAATTARGPRTRLDVDERRAQLVQLGAVLFSTQAFDQVSIDDVAKAAGISKGLLFHYFPTKRDFYVATVEHTARRLLETTRSPDASSGMERVQHGLDAYLQYVHDHAGAFAGLLRSGIGADPAVARIVEETRTRFLRRLLADVGVEEPKPRLRSALRGWLGFVEAMALDWIDHKDVEPVALRDMMVDALQQAVQSAINRRLTLGPSVVRSP